jgi:hypothetical protein
MADRNPLASLESLLRGFQKDKSGLFIPQEAKSGHKRPLPQYEQAHARPMRTLKTHAMFNEERRKAKLKRRNRKTNKRAHRARMVNAQKIRG